MIKSHEHEISAHDQHEQPIETIVMIDADSDDANISDSETATSNDEQIHHKENEHQH